MDEKEIKATIDFFVAASKACGEQRGVVVEFECPICKEKARAIRNTYNGHLRAKCEACGCSMME